MCNFSPAKRENAAMTKKDKKIQNNKMKSVMAANAIKLFCSEVEIRNRTVINVLTVWIARPPGCSGAVGCIEIYDTLGKP
jgi:hypothetical protein